MMSIRSWSMLSHEAAHSTPLPGSAMSWSCPQGTPAAIRSLRSSAGVENFERSLPPHAARTSKAEAAYNTRRIDLRLQIGAPRSEAPSKRLRLDHFED